MRAKELTVYRDDSAIMWTKRILVLFAVLVLFASTVFGMGQSAIAAPAGGDNAALDNASLEASMAGSMSSPAATAEAQSIDNALQTEPPTGNSTPMKSGGSETPGSSSLVPSGDAASDPSHADETVEAPPAKSLPADQEADPTTPADVPTEPSVDESLETDQAASTEDDQSADDPTAPEMSQGLAGPEVTSAQLLNIGPQADGLAAPEALFKEDFENGSAAVPLALGSYQGVTGIKYTASDYWRDAKYCNGFITTAESIPTRNQVAQTYCGLNGDSTDNNLGDYNAVRTKA